MMLCLGHFKESSSSTGILKIIREFHDRFIEEYGSIICSDIQKKIFGRSFNLLDKDKCPIVVGKAAVWIVEIFM